VVKSLEIPVLFHPHKVADLHMIATAYPPINFIMAHLGSFSAQNWSEHLALTGRFKTSHDVMDYRSQERYGPRDPEACY
jgi:hypothetical protein